MIFLSKKTEKLSCIRREKRFPPGPPWVPLLGSVPFLQGRGIEKFVGPTVKKFGRLSKSTLIIILLTYIDNMVVE
jgi:hypothetical protein